MSEDGGADWIKVAGFILGLWGASLSTWTFVSARRRRSKVTIRDIETNHGRGNTLIVEVSNSGRDRYISVIKLEAKRSDGDYEELETRDFSTQIGKDQVIRWEIEISKYARTRIFRATAYIDHSPIQSNNYIVASK